MITQQLIDYIKQQQNLGKTNDEIKTALCSTGWSLLDVENAIHATPSSQPNIPQFSTSSNFDPAIGEEIDDKPKIINVVNKLYWTVALLSLGGAVMGGSVVQVMNNVQKNGYPGALDYSFIKFMPYLPIVSLIGTVSCLAYFYAALKLSNGSNKAWKVGLFTLLGVALLGFVSSAAIAILTRNLYSQIESF